MNTPPDGFLDLGKSPEKPAEMPKDVADKKYYPSLHFDGKADLPDEGEAHIRFRKHELVTRKDKGGEHHSHHMEIVAIKPLGKKPKSPSKGLSDTLDEMEGNKMQKAQAKEINGEESDEQY